ncbi:hypothetical protein ACJX0J_037470, partial [Zea mays]
MTFMTNFVNIAFSIYRYVIALFGALPFVSLLHVSYHIQSSHLVLLVSTFKAPTEKHNNKYELLEDEIHKRSFLGSEFQSDIISTGVIFVLSPMKRATLKLTLQFNHTTHQKGALCRALDRTHYFEDLRHYDVGGKGTALANRMHLFYGQEEDKKMVFSTSRLIDVRKNIDIDKKKEILETYLNDGDTGITTDTDAWATFWQRIINIFIHDSILGYRNPHGNM